MKQTWDELAPTVDGGPNIDPNRVVHLRTACPPLSRSNLPKIELFRSTISSIVPTHFLSRQSLLLLYYCHGSEPHPAPILLLFKSFSWLS